MQVLWGPAQGCHALRPKPVNVAPLHARTNRRCACHARCAAGNGEQESPTYSDANFPSSNGRTYHLGTKKGEVANRILTVGSTQRAEMLAELLEPHCQETPLMQKLSSRGFMTITGSFKGVPVSIISHLMGMSNMDFMVRECRAVVEGQMAIVRLGTCGAVQPPARLGNLLVASHGSINVRRNPDAWTLGNGTPRYVCSLPVEADKGLTSLLVSGAHTLLGADSVVQGLNATADSFYSSQGRVGGDFDDHNVHLLTDLCAQYPRLISLEMETFQLLDLARCSKGSIRAAGMCIALAERYSNQFLDSKLLAPLELQGGMIALEALAQLPLQGETELDLGMECDAMDLFASGSMSTVDFYRS